MLWRTTYIPFNNKHTFIFPSSYSSFMQLANLATRWFTNIDFKPDFKIPYFSKVFEIWLLFLTFNLSTLRSYIYWQWYISVKKPTISILSAILTPVFNISCNRILLIKIDVRKICYKFARIQTFVQTTRHWTQKTNTWTLHSTFKMTGETIKITSIFLYAFFVLMVVSIGKMKV